MRSAFSITIKLVETGKIMEFKTSTDIPQGVTFNIIHCQDMR